jgi:hypothetical protein
MEFTPVREVWTAAPVAWEKARDNEMSSRLYRVLQRWVPFANEQFLEWNGRPNCGHFFGGSFWYVSDSASTSLVFAVLAKLGDYDETVAGVPRRELLEKAVKAIRYMGFTHDTGPEDCVRAKGVLPYTSEKKWGGKGDNFFMASQNGRSIASFALASWLLWDDLDNETKLLVQNVAASYADRWSDEEPRSGVYYDTQCEENAWTAAGISAALALFPEHPRHAQWKQAFVCWSMNTITTYKDRLADPSGLIDTPAGNVVKSVTFHPDFTAENHAFVHPSYLCAGINLRSVHAVFSLIGDQEILSSALHNNENLYSNTLKRWVQFDGLCIPVQGQDWWYNRQHERQLTHAVLNVIHGDSDAARLARNALDSIEKQQLSNSRGCLLEERGEECVINRAHAQFAKDLEHGSAVDLASSYLLHVFGGPGAEPSDPQEMVERLSGVYHYSYGNTVVHRTNRTFTSFTYRNNVMGLTLPEQGLWNVTPLYSSYVGTMRIKDHSANPAISNETMVRSVSRSNITAYENGFGASVSIERGDGHVRQDVAFIALPDGASVYVEQLHAMKACAVAEAATGLIGIRNENYAAMPHLAPGQRTLYTADGSADAFAGFYGREPNFEKSYAPTRYVNIDHKIGYILFGSRGIRYINKHEYPKWKGVEDILILNDMGDMELTEGQTLSPFCVVSLPNASADDTKQREALTFLLHSDQEGTHLLQTGDTLVYACFRDAQTRVKGRRAIAGRSVPLFEGRNLMEQGQFLWTSKLPAFSCGFMRSKARIEADRWDNLMLDISVTEDQAIIVNRASDTATFSLVIAVAEEEQAQKVVPIEIPAGGYVAISL